MINTKRTSLFLMANLGAEVSRIISARERNDNTLMQGALKRAEQIIKEIENLPDIKARINEIELLSKAIHSLANPVSELQITPQNIKSYFTPFAMRMMGS